MSDNTLVLLTEEELRYVNGGAGIVNIVSGITVVAGVVGLFCPPVLLVAAVGGAFLLGYGIGEAIRG